MNEVLYPMAVIAVVAIVTWILRAFPFLLFGNRPLPKTILYLGKVLPPAIMTVLVIYCLRDISFTRSPYGVPEIVACAIVAAHSQEYVSIDYSRNDLLHDTDPYCLGCCVNMLLHKG